MKIITPWGSNDFVVLKGDLVDQLNKLIILLLVIYLLIDKIRRK